MRLMVVAAHTDDVVYGVGGTLLLHDDAESSIVSITRLQETASREAAEQLGAEIDFLDGTYGSIAQSAERLALALQARIEAFQPDYLFAPPTAGDIKPDHQAAGQMALDALVASGLMGSFGTKILRYFIPATTFQFEPSVWVDVSGPLVEQKTEIALRLVRGAEEVWPDDVVHWEISTGVRFGQEVGWPTTHAEAFEAPQRLAFARLPERNTSLAHLHERHLALFDTLKTGGDPSRAKSNGPARGA